MEFGPDDVFEILKSTPDTVRMLLQDVPDHWLACDEGPDTFSPIDVVGHLVHGEEADWIPRAKIILEHGESVPFEPFDRFGFRKKYGGMDLDELLDEFENRRTRNIEELIQLDPSEEQLQLTGMHPELGRVTLGQLIATWAVHDLVHINQITRVMVKHSADAIGPWTKYVSLLQ